MTLDEAIKHCEEKADELNKEVLNQANLCNAREMADCQECARDHEQLAEWLKELKAYKESEPSVIKINIPEETRQKLIEELQKPHKLLVLPDPEIEFERPHFNRGELEKALNYWYEHLERHNEEQNEAAWCAINAIRYCIENSSAYQE